MATLWRWACSVIVRRAQLLAAFVALSVLGFVSACTPRPPVVTYTYSVKTVGPVTAPVREFAAEAARIYRDGRGWSDWGKVAFRQVATGGQFILWLLRPTR
jgi:hypothetical protein